MSGAWEQFLHGDKTLLVYEYDVQAAAVRRMTY